MAELADIAKEKGRDLSHLIGQDFRVFEENLNNGEILVASWKGNQLPVDAGELLEETVNNPNRTIHWVYAVKAIDIPSYLWD